MTESHDQYRAKTEEEELMPRSAPRPPLRRLAHRSSDPRPARYGSNQNEREYATLAGQLDALEHDIEHARAISHGARGAPGLTQHADDDTTPGPERGEAVTLPDGARILIRAIEPDDAGRLRSAFEHLGEVSRYRRFLSPIDHLSPRQLEFLTHVDHQTHEALVAVDPTTGELVGVARYVCDPDDTRQAEIAVVVADDWQDRGTGTALVERLTARARAAGVERFKARLLIGDHAGRRLLAHVADKISERKDGGTARLTARLRSTGEQDASPPAPTEPSRPSGGRWTVSLAAVRERLRRR